MPEEFGDWDPEIFEKHGREVISQIRGHFEKIRDVPVAVPRDPAELKSAVAADPPETGELFERVLADTWEKVVPGLVQWNHPSFHAYFPTSASLPGVLAETLTAALNVNSMLWQTSPAATALELVVLRWLAAMAGYPQDADGLLVTGASLANLYALAAARDHALDFDVRERGTGGPGAPTLRIYTSDQAHSSVDKAAITLGTGLANVVRVPSDEQYRMRPDLLDEAIRRDLAAGFRPLAVVATVGTTAVGAADPLERVAEVCAGHGVWLHVDAAYGGLYRLAPSLAGTLEDLSVGDSVVVNPQKTLFVPLDSTALFCRRPGALARTFRLVPEYLTSAHDGDTTDLMDLSPQLGRGFRALKVWWVIRTFGRAGLAARLDASVALARRLRERVDRHPDWTCPAPSAYPLVCLRYTPEAVTADPRLSEGRKREITDALNARILRRVNASGTAFLSHAVLRDGYVLRLSIGNIRTVGEDVERVWRELDRIAAAELAEPTGTTAWTDPA
ncbi:PLP-dependent decarboxylase [Streptomyces parvulus]|uniref:pyridoxal phosphate-dependent decarboxylase family protein n=1 Tax=Streptomyces parvulus TaxID=146923 RepID=UPI001E5DBBBA|nr:pyridoxal-dependent decarboxylase [Streptomyces parvulus]MCC9152679.1 PLP-dependent decarboxylase [Streptomyces parvulus]MCE7687173.1 PLP-dependent decarboxylase [Streptomyces parvulus]